MVPRKSHYFTIVAHSFMKMVADRHGVLPITTSISDEFFSCSNIGDFERL